jgi:hypothetical protein
MEGRKKEWEDGGGKRGRGEEKKKGGQGLN